ATGDIGFFAIVSEGGVAAGVRRIEAFTGAGAVAWAQQQRAAVSSVLDALHVSADQAVDAIEKLQSETKRLARELSHLKTRKAIAPMVGGAGGGRPDFAEAGGKNPEKVDEMLQNAGTVIAAMLEA